MQRKVICVDLKYRFLSLDDLPAIRELSDSMGGWNSPPIGETAERRIKDPLCDLYGAFTEEGELVGVGALRTLTKDYAWIEAVRVHGKYQKIGIGTSIFKYGEELARKRNCKIIACPFQAYCTMSSKRRHKPRMITRCIKEIGACFIQETCCK